MTVASDDVAVVGMAVLFPQAPNLDAYWRNLVAGLDATGSIAEARRGLDARSADRADARADRRGGFLDLAEIAVARLGLPSCSVADLAPDQLIALGVAADALRDAGGPEAVPDRDRVGVVLGTGSAPSPQLIELSNRLHRPAEFAAALHAVFPELDESAVARLRDHFGAGQPESPPTGVLPASAAAKLAHRLDLRGPAYTVDGACASSLIAVDHAVGELLRNRCDLMLAGGSHQLHDATLWSVLGPLRTLSPGECTRPFDQRADGTLIGEGTGIVVLKRLADARRDGDRVYVVIRGIGVAGDGGTSGGPAEPSVDGQTRALAEAWRAAGLDPRAPDSVGLLEAHGIATEAGDAAELATLAEVFGAEPAGSGVLGSVKSMIGHTLPAAGIAGLVKAALAVYHGVLPPTPNCEQPHPALARTRFRSLSEALNWESPAGTPRRAAVNAFGFGGINAHVILEQAPPGDPGHADLAQSSQRTLRLAAANPTELADLLTASDEDVLAAGLAEDAPAPGRCRLAVVDPTPKRLGFARRVVASGRSWRGRNDIWFTIAPLLSPEAGGRLAFVFPGLDSESEAGFDTDTDAGEQPVFGVLSLGLELDRQLRSAGVVPDAIAGHSLGEWNAMASAGVIDRPVTARMLATAQNNEYPLLDLTFVLVGASVSEVGAALAAHPELVISHDNSPRQSIVCGPAVAADRFVRSCRDRGVIAWELPVRSGAHTPMFAPLAARFEDQLAQTTLRPAETELWSATLAAPFPADAQRQRELILRHLVEPVRFTELVEAMYAAGIRAFIQPGIGQVPALIDDILGDREHLTISAHQAGRDGRAGRRRIRAALWADGWQPASARESADRGTLPVRLRFGPDPLVLPEADRVGIRAVLGRCVPPSGPDRLPAPPRRSAGTTASSRELFALLGEIEESAQWAADWVDGANTTAAAIPQPAADLVAEAPQLAGPQATGPNPAAEVPVDRAEGGGLAPISEAPPTILDPTTHQVFPAPQTEAAVADTADEAVPIAARTALVPEQGRSIGGLEIDEPPTTPDRVDGEVHATLTVSLDTMPHLRDHSFYDQRPGWPDASDRMPVMPATGVVAHIVDFVQRAVPHRVVTEVGGLLLRRWFTAVPTTSVRVIATPLGADRYRVQVGDHAEAVVTLADRLPDSPPAPEIDRSAEHPSWHTAEQLYSRRLMFHGPIFAKVRAVSGIGDRHVRGVVQASDVPGVLLDNAGQLFGYWIQRSPAVCALALPMGVSAIRFHGPPPAPGTAVDCLVTVTSISDADVVGDIRLSVAGRVIVEIIGWRNRIFFPADRVLAALQNPTQLTVAVPQRSGWVLLRESWPGLAARDFVLGGMLAAAERAEYRECPARARRHWLLGRLAAKDAVRALLWEGPGAIASPRRDFRELPGETGLYPAELRIYHDAAGRPRVTGLHGRVLPELSISLAHSGTVAVAIAVPGSGGVGIDVEKVAPRTPETIELALDASERGLLADLVGLTGESTDLWFARFWTAKEAAGKAEGIGLAGGPRRFSVRTRPDGDLAVTVPGGMVPRTYRVRTTSVEAASPERPDQPGDRYVVAWTVQEDE
ncbi:type I polyketide synthase [Actinoalloteichus hymeniacidonis]|uniref:Polyketide synthase family protein n=1 Tax=Actinoalloteichus hymeniacidonis TaxID=340345 RepID=A0AAC9HSB6_9PSEU|nr:type I polyketide synthase [Actinoalloteichus hymeniacidonis]AOS64465.1 polyketide synthase family protein [Actinoalloteichus hymeniacidonis]MBB5907465.1 acyl transferase domain-containing protein/phosphopantetheinyl transferase [Actinoalloteichus hymeniacidonis]